MNLTRREISKRYYEKAKKEGKLYAQKYPERYVAYHRKYRLENADKIRAWKDKVRAEVLFHYCSGELQCACCGEKEIGFLTLDHINNDGAEHRKKLGKEGRRGVGGYAFYAYLRKNNYPKDYKLQVLCYNCNCAKQFLGRCPHVK